MTTVEWEKLGCGMVEVDDQSRSVEWLYSSGLTDGLPTVAPTPEAVMLMIGGGHLDPEVVIGSIPGRDMSITVGQAAVCAVMAGALPEYFPVVLASWAAVLDPAFNAHGVLTSTSGVAVTCVVSGPYATRIGMNSGAGLFSPGNRANTTIGRALRLGAMCVFDARPGVLDATAFGNGGKYSSHFAEKDPPGPWMPVRMRAGHDRNATTVTPMATDGPRTVRQTMHRDPHRMIRVFAAAMRDPTITKACRPGAGFLIVVGPEHADIFLQAGWTQDDVCRKIAQEAQISVAELDYWGVELEANKIWPADSNGLVATCAPEDILLVTAGGFGAGFSSLLPSTRSPAGVKTVEVVTGDSVR